MGGIQLYWMDVEIGLPVDWLFYDFGGMEVEMFPVELGIHPLTTTSQLFPNEFTFSRHFQMGRRSTCIQLKLYNAPW